jgi:CysZ protein
LPEFGEDRSFTTEALRLEDEGGAINPTPSLGTQERRLRMLNDFLKGASYFWRGLPMIFRKKIRPFAFWPILITVLLLSLVIWASSLFFTDLVSWTHAKLPEWLEWADWIFWILFGGLWVLVWIFGFVLVANIVAAPFNGLLSEAVERRLTGHAPNEVPWKRTIKRLPVIAWNETKKVLYYVAWAVPFAIASCVFSVIAPILWAWFSSWMFAVEFCDYPMDNREIPFREVRRRVGQRWSTSLGFGASTLLAFSIPGLNLVAMPAAVAGATIFWIEELKTPEDA